MDKPLLIVGANAAGCSAAMRARRRDPDREIIVLEAGRDFSWGACGMPYNLEDPGRQAEDLKVRGIEYFQSRQIQIALSHRVTALDLRHKRVKVLRGDMQEELDMPWHQLVIASGTRSRIPEVPGSGQAPLFSFKQLDDLRLLKSRLARMQRVAVLGAGPVGLELCESLHPHVKQIVLFDMEELPLPAWPQSIRKEVLEELHRQQVEFVGGSRLNGFQTHGTCALSFENGQEYSGFDTVIACLGLVPNTDWAVAAGLATDDAGRLLVNEFMQTSHPEIYAAGDCVIRPSCVPPIADEVDIVYNPQALEANRGGRVAGWNAAGPAGHDENRTIPTGPGTMILRCFGLELARSGRLTSSEDGTVQAGQSRVVPDVGRGLLGQGLTLETSREPLRPGVHRVEIHSRTKGHGMTGSGDMCITLESTSTGQLRGAALLARGQGAGRVNVIATLLQQSADVSELAALDLAYSPPFGPTWDPLLIAASELEKTLPS